MSTARDRLLELLKARALFFGRFVLASGQESLYYVNSKKVLFHSEFLALLGEQFYELTRDLDIQAVGGLEVGALPIAAATVMAYHHKGQSLEGFFVRKQAKGHGSQERVEGVLQAGWKVAIVDDVLTTGGSAQQAIEAVEAAGAEVAAVVCIVDRLQGARELFSPRYRYRPLFTIRDLGVQL